MIEDKRSGSGPSRILSGSFSLVVHCVSQLSNLVAVWLFAPLSGRKGKNTKASYTCQHWALMGRGRTGLEKGRRRVGSLAGLTSTWLVLSHTAPVPGAETHQSLHSLQSLGAAFRMGAVVNFILGLAIKIHRAGGNLRGSRFGGFAIRSTGQ